MVRSFSRSCSQRLVHLCVCLFFFLISFYFVLFFFLSVACELCCIENIWCAKICLPFYLTDTILIQNSWIIKMHFNCKTFILILPFSPHDAIIQSNKRIWFLNITICRLPFKMPISFFVTVFHLIMTILLWNIQYILSYDNDICNFLPSFLVSQWEFINIIFLKYCDGDDDDDELIDIKMKK